MLAALQLTVGLFFFASAIPKLQQLRDFVRAVEEYQILPHRASVLFGYVVPPLELLLGLSHVTGIGTTVTVPAALILLSAFGIAVAINLRRGRDIPCHCFGAADGQVISSTTLVRIGLLICGELILLLRLVVDGSRGTPISYLTLGEWLDALTGVLILLTCSMWILAYKHLFQVFGIGACRTCPRQRELE